MFREKLRGAGAFRRLPRSVSAGGAAVQTRGLAFSREGVELHDLVNCRPLHEFPRVLAARLPGRGRSECDLGRGKEGNLNS